MLHRDRAFAVTACPHPPQTNRHFEPPADQPVIQRKLVRKAEGSVGGKVGSLWPCSRGRIRRSQTVAITWWLGRGSDIPSGFAHSLYAGVLPGLGPIISLAYVVKYIDTVSFCVQASAIFGRPEVTSERPSSYTVSLKRRNTFPCRHTANLTKSIYERFYSPRLIEDGIIKFFRLGLSNYVCTHQYHIRKQDSQFAKRYNGLSVGYLRKRVW